MEEKFDVLNEFGEFTGQVATREECHTKGLRHRAVYGVVIDKESNVLLQKRSDNEQTTKKWEMISIIKDMNCCLIYDVCLLK